MSQMCIDGEFFNVIWRQDLFFCRKTPGNALLMSQICNYWPFKVLNQKALYVCCSYVVTIA